MAHFVDYATLITCFQHISGYRKQSRRKKSISFANPFTELRWPHAKSVTDSYPPRHESKQGERDLDSVTKAGRISGQGQQHPRERNVNIPPEHIA